MSDPRLPQDDDKYQWTNHVKEKMAYYRISPSLVKRIVRFPKRKEEGIAPGTIAVMMPRVSTTRSRGKIGKKNEEIWVMLQEIQKSKGNSPVSEAGSQKYKSKLISLINQEQPKIRIISAWRYPGISPVGKKIPIPDEILQELESII